MKKFNWSGVQKIINGAIAFSEKNAPSLITGGSILLGWAAVYVFWKQSKKAEKEIEETEEQLLIKNEEGESVSRKLSNKDKATIYLKYCWLAALMGAGSTAGTVLAHKMDLSRLAEMYMLTQFLEGKNSDQEKLINKLKGEVSGKKFNDLKTDVMKEKYPEETVSEGNIEETGKGTTLFIDELTGIKFRSSITAVTDGLYEFKGMLRERRDKELRSKFGDAFYVSDSPYPDDFDVYASEGLDVFFECLGVKQKVRLGEILEFRDYGYKDFMPLKQVLYYEPYIDPVTGVPAVCFIRISDYLSPTYELMERNPL